MENVKFNKCQTPLEELHLEKYPAEVQEQFWDFLNNVPFIRWMVSPDRPLVSELPRDDEGRAIIDITYPPILEDSDYFRPSALAYKANKGRYVLLRPNANPNSDFGKWLYSQRERGWNGYCNPATGMWVTGDYYWMLNFCPMHLVENENGIDIRTVAHPRFWDGQFLMSHYFLQARTHGHHAAELASRGKGKAHPYSQLVYTPDGVKEWGDIQVGDVLFGDDGNLTKVTHIPFDEEEKIYTVTLSDGRKLQCTSGHLFYVKDHRKKNKMQVIDLWTIMHSDYAHKRKDGGIEYYYAIPNNKKVEFNSQRVLIDPYTLGLLIGDGCLTKSCLNVAELTSGEEDFEFYKQQVPYDMYARKGKYSHGIKINNLQGKLLEYNLWNTTSDTKFIPKEYMFNSSDVRIALLQGIMDTDGTVNNNGVPMFTTTSERLAKDVRWLCHSLGYNSTMFTKQGKYTDINGQHLCKVTYNVTVLTNDPIFRLQRKLDKLTGFNSAYSKSRRDWTRIVDIKYSHREKAKCVVVDNENHCYLIGDFIVTHNTSFGGGLLAKRCIIGESENNKTEVQCMVTAVDRTKLMDTNQILRVFKDNLDHCAKYTQFASHRLKSSDQEMEWKMGFKKAGSEVEYGSKNSVSGIITGVNQDKLNGSRGVLYLIEEAGIFKNLTSMYNMIRPSVEHGSKVFGEIFAYGTAGDDQSDFTAFAEMFYSPEGYNLEPLDNVFDKEGQGRKKCCFFFPAYLNYDESCIDKNGNSDVSKALLMILYDRYKVKYGTTDINTIVKRISQYPIVPQEAMLRSHGNIFPVTELNERLNQLDNDPNAFDDVYVGELVQDNKTGEVKFNPTIDLPIRDFPTKDNKVKGALEIFEMPKKNGEGKIPAGRYICSADPYDADCSNTMSLGSIFVMDLWTDMIVAEYTGRPTFAEDFYEICRKLCLFYNCRCMYEQNVMGMFSYFSSHNATHLLAETPEYLVQRNMISSIGYGNKSVGIRATTPIINGAFKMIQTWLRKPIVSIETDAEGNNNEVSIPNLYRIKNRALLKELVLWNPQGNFDRVMSLVQLMLYREEKMVLYHGDLRHTEEVSSGMEKDDYWDKNYPGKKNYAIAVKSYYL
nr:MAG TPA: Terminase large subunit [Crassvirales sp.]